MAPNKFPFFFRCQKRIKLFEFFSKLFLIFLIQFKIRTRGKNVAQKCLPYIRASDLSSKKRKRIPSPEIDEKEIFDHRSSSRTWKTFLSYADSLSGKFYLGKQRPKPCVCFRLLFTSTLRFFINIHGKQTRTVR